MLQSIITSKTRIKLLLKFFLNTRTRSYLRHLEQEFGESSNAIRVELNRLEAAGLLTAEMSGNRKYFSANTAHPLFDDINSILKKFVGIDQIIDRITSKVGDLEAAFITGDFAKGRDSQIIDLVLTGENLDRKYIHKLVEKAENIIGRKIRYLVLTAEQMMEVFKDKPRLLIWKADTEERKEGGH
ncbi:winged helix-turn-helix domain-containing protein [Maribellus maritimus]|nr:winged helix-turn-helix domain-containing protein [Maribellus maritimus]